MPAPLVAALLGAVARAGASMFARQGAKALAGKAGRVAMGTISKGQTVLEGASWTNAKKMSQALDWAKSSGLDYAKGRGRAAAQAVVEKGISSARKGGKSKAGPGEPEPIEGKQRKDYLEYLKSMRKGSLEDRYKRLQEAGNLATTTEVAKAKGTQPMAVPSRSQRVQFSERRLAQKKREELRTQQKLQQGNQSLARATFSLVKGPASFGALSLALQQLTSHAKGASDGLAMYSNVIATQLRVSGIHQMMRQIQTARGTEKTFGFAEGQRRFSADAWRKPNELLTNIGNLISGVGSTISGIVGTAATGIITLGETMLVELGIISRNTGEDDLPQQAFRDYWNAMSAGNWNQNLPGRPAAPPVTHPLDEPGAKGARKTLEGFTHMFRG